MIIKIPTKVEIRKCPGCGHMEYEVVIELSIFNFPCPKCGKFSLSDFVPTIESKKVLKMKEFEEGDRIVFHNIAMNYIPEEENPGIAKDMSNCLGKCGKIIKLSDTWKNVFTVKLDNGKVWHLHKNWISLADEWGIPIPEPETNTEVKEPQPLSDNALMESIRKAAGRR